MTVISYSVFQYHMNYKVIEKLSAKQIEQVNSILSTNLQTMMQFPLATNDVDAISRIATDLLRHEMIWAIEVQDENHKILDRKERMDTEQGITLKRQTIEIHDYRAPLNIDVTSENDLPSDQLLGFVYLYLTNDYQLEELNEQLLSQTLIHLIVLVLLIILLTSLIGNFTRHVRNANVELQKIIEGDYNVKITRSRVMDFNVLASKIEDVANALSVQMSTLKDSQVEAEKKQLEAEESNSAKVKFMQIISHEMRSPVHVIVNLFSSVARDITKGDTKNAENLLAICEASASELLAVIDELLDVQAFENGAVKINKAEYSISDTISEICGRYYNRAKAKKLNYDFEDAHNFVDYTAIFDKGKLDRILSNLIENAVKYTQKGFISIAWSVEQNNTLVVKVIDSGIGISVENQTKVFEQFYQVNAPTVRREDGRGIGLSIVKQLLTLLGGDIVIESVPKRGTTFTIRLPIDITNTVQQTLGDIDSYLDKDCKVLVIDNEENCCIVMMEQLKEYDIIPEYATDPSTGLNMALRKHYDVILVDYFMPDLDGAALTKVIRENDINANTVIICVTAGDEHHTHTSLMDTGVFDYVIHKPFGAEELAEYIDKALYARQVSKSVVYAQFTGSKKRD